MARLAAYATAIMGKRTYEFGYRFGLKRALVILGHGVRLSENVTTSPALKHTETRQYDSENAFQGFEVLIVCNTGGDRSIRRSRSRSDLGRVHGVQLPL